MSLGHDFQDIVGPKGSVIKACRYCLCKIEDPLASQACQQNIKITNTMPPLGEQSNVGAVAAVATLPASTKPLSMVELIKSLDADAIEAKIAELSGEIAGLEVLLTAARARDLKAKQP